MCHLVHQRIDMLQPSLPILILAPQKYPLTNPSLGNPTNIPPNSHFERWENHPNCIRSKWSSMMPNSLLHPIILPSYKWSRSIKIFSQRKRGRSCSFVINRENMRQCSYSNKWIARVRFQWPSKDNSNNTTQESAIEKHTHKDNSYIVSLLDLFFNFCFRCNLLNAGNLTHLWLRRLWLFRFLLLLLLLHLR